MDINNFIFLNHCSFDNKSGIWKSEESISEERNNQFKKFKVSSSYTPYDKLVSLDKILFKPLILTNPLEWKDIFLSKIIILQILNIMLLIELFTNQKNYPTTI